MPDVRAKALAYYRSGAIRVLTASTAVSSDRPFLVEARVQGYRSDYIVRHQDPVTGWTCTCRQAGCAHVAAVQLATGHDSAAAPNPTPAKATQ